MRRLLALPLALALVTPAEATPREIAMTASGGRQHGTLVYYTDVSRDGALCVSQHADGPGGYPDPVRHDGSSLTWRLDDPRRPAAASVLQSRVGVEEYELVEPVKLPVRLEPVRHGKRTVAWVVRTEPVGSGDLRLLLSVRWPREACGQDEALYRYRALSLPA